MSSGDNFVKKNLKKRFSHYKKSVNPISKRLKQSDLNFFEDNESDSGAIQPNHGSDSNSEHAGSTVGMKSWGVDPLNLSLDWLDKLKSPDDAKPETTKTALSVLPSKNIRGLSNPTIDYVNIDKSSGSLGLSALVTEIDSRQLKKADEQKWQDVAPKCNGHQMPCKLLTVNKPGPNKVDVNVFLVTIPQFSPSITGQKILCLLISLRSKM
jgi:hypothetical protein